MVLSKKPFMPRQKVFWFTLIFSRTLFPAALVLLRDIKGASPRNDDGLRDVPSLQEILLRTDPLGTVLSISGFVLLTDGLTSGNISSWDTGAVIGKIVAAVILLVCFIFVEARIARNPLVPRYLWTGAYLAGGLWFGGAHIRGMARHQSLSLPLNSRVRKHSKTLISSTQPGKLLTVCDTQITASQRSKPRLDFCPWESQLFS